MLDQTTPSSANLPSSGSPRAHGNVSVPLGLLLDERLTPLERNAWMVFRARVGEDGTSALPNYEQMRPFLACKAGNQRAAYETASRTVCVLRMTRWVHLAGHRRDPLTGQVQNTLYAVHDAPQSCQAVCASDSGYFDLLECSVAHPNLVVRSIAIGMLNELAADGDLPVALRQRVALARKRSGLGSDDDCNPPPSSPQQGKEPSPVVQGDTGSTTSKADSPVRTYKYSLNKEVRTYRASAQENTQPAAAGTLRLPSCLDKMAPDQHRDVQMALRRLPGEHQQAVLDELEARVRLGAVRNVVAYLFGLVRRVLAGEFRLWAARKPASPEPANRPADKAPSAAPPALPSSPTPQYTPAAPEVAQAYLARTRRLLGLRAREGDLVAEMFLQDGHLRPNSA
ncbi:STY4528 family pathogenicity island replication protein [Burkholderia aenigmatica]|uniref:STY4528 family pathogenicity island replication protein n=1 Tax=Burkholderia aenigmatica TaxID=2015348 RepID=UPI0026515324|nr:STY4528 family pathogenicity island replication protein [Burkholderia aenigmatica]MDN7880236.1 STY4528 family pathogenicity island replication protein [Burkholderia aenigmatica]